MASGPLSASGGAGHKGRVAATGVFSRKLDLAKEPPAYFCPLLLLRQ